MPYRQVALVNLMIVTTFGRFVAEEVHLIVALDMTQAIRFVPTNGEDVERDLSPLERKTKRKIKNQTPSVPYKASESQATSGRYEPDVR